MDESIDDWEKGYPVKPLDKYDLTERETWIPEANDPEALKSLLDFSVNNRDLDRLEAIISEFNPFKILGVADMEIRHSNVLAWLIDPAGHHGLGDRLFKCILLEILKSSVGGELPKINEVISADFADLKVLREWRNIDVFAVSPSNKIAVVIENKWGADESDNQLTKYAGIVDRKYKDYKRVFVFLTLDGTPPNKEKERYIPFKHEQIHGIVKSTVELRKDFMHTKVYDFIQQYLKILEDATMQNAEFIDICNKLYREHKDAIRMITEYGRPKLEPKHIQDFHKRTKTESVFMYKDSVNVHYNFVPCAWSKLVPQTSVNSDKYLVSFQFSFNDYENHKIPLYLYISNFPETETDERRRFVKMVSEANKDDILSVKTASKTTTTVFRKTIPLTDESGGEFGFDDYEAVTDKLVKAYKSEDVKKAFEIMDKVVQAFWGNTGGGIK